MSKHTKRYSGEAFYNKCEYVTAHIIWEHKYPWSFFIFLHILKVKNVSFHMIYHSFKLDNN